MDIPKVEFPSNFMKTSEIFTLTSYVIFVDIRPVCFRWYMKKDGLISYRFALKCKWVTPNEIISLIATEVDMSFHNYFNRLLVKYTHLLERPVDFCIILQLRIVTATQTKYVYHMLFVERTEQLVNNILEWILLNDFYRTENIIRIDVLIEFAILTCTLFSLWLFN